jgi:hypothetical protein
VLVGPVLYYLLQQTQFSFTKFTIAGSVCPLAQIHLQWDFCENRPLCHCNLRSSFVRNSSGDHEFVWSFMLQLARAPPIRRMDIVARPVCWTSPNVPLAGRNINDLPGDVVQPLLRRAHHQHPPRYERLRVGFELVRAITHLIRKEVAGRNLYTYMYP